VLLAGCGAGVLELLGVAAELGADGEAAFSPLVVQEGSISEAKTNAVRVQTHFIPFLLVASPDMSLRLDRTCLDFRVLSYRQSPTRTNGAQ